MEVTVLYFATLRDYRGLRQECLTLPDSTTVADLKAILCERHSNLASALEAAILSVNREYAYDADELHDGDEVALFPPVSGGAGEPGPTVFHTTEEPLDLNELLEKIILPTSGAACVFTGVVRGHTERCGEHKTTYLEYEAYNPMAKEKMQQVVDEIRSRWPSVEGVAIVPQYRRS